MGGGGQGCTLSCFRCAAPSGHWISLSLQSSCQELTGYFWVNGRGLGRQYLGMGPDTEQTDMLVAIGWNGWMSTRCAGPTAFEEDLRRPRQAARGNRSQTFGDGSESGHTPGGSPRDGRASLRSMISIILAGRIGKRQTIFQSSERFEEIKPWFLDFDPRPAIKLCQLDYDQVHDVCRLPPPGCVVVTVISDTHGEAQHCRFLPELILLAICAVSASGGNLIRATSCHMGLIPMNATPGPGVPPRLIFLQSWAPFHPT